MQRCILCHTVTENPTIVHAYFGRKGHSKGYPVCRFCERTNWEAVERFLWDQASVEERVSARGGEK